VTRPEIDYLTLDDLLEIAKGILDEVQVRDIGLLESAVARPRTSVFGEDAYVEFDEKAAALLHSVVRNHALVDGNKGLAWASMRTFCLLNDLDITYQVDDAESMVLEAAAGEIEVAEIAAWKRERLVDVP
jgi:death-on-curing protein